MINVPNINSGSAGVRRLNIDEGSSIVLRMAGANTGSAGAVRATGANTGSSGVPRSPRPVRTGRPSK